MIDHNLLEQVGTLFQGLESHYIFRITYHSSFAEAAELIEFLSEVSSCSENIVCETILSEDLILQFSLIKQGKETGIIFRGIPSGHEFSSLILAVLNADGKGKNLPDAAIIRRIESLKGSIHIQSFISLSCTNCPDIVQALNVLALINPHLTHEIVDGTLFESEVTALKIQAVPTVYANGELLHVGRGSLGELLQKLEERFAQADLSKQKDPEKAFDVIVLGGGPAGASAAVYSARKGLKVAVIAKRIGGQVKETVAIENLIATPHTTGAVLADQLRTHMNEYDISLFEEREIVNLSIDGKHKRVAVAGGERFKAP
ncbi:MAG: FAD-dependent oxidoreductase, partial [Phocaeicola sp.]